MRRFLPRMEKHPGVVTSGQKQCAPRSRITIGTRAQNDESLLTRAHTASAMHVSANHMATRRIRKSKSLTVKSMELALSVLQVFAHRVTRMALAGPTLCDRDRKEFQIMVNEKHAALAQAWSDMAMHAFRANQAFTASTASCSPSRTRADALAAEARSLVRAMRRIVALQFVLGWSVWVTSALVHARRARHASAARLPLHRRCGETPCR
jgi:hypothetical protein